MTENQINYEKLAQEALRGVVREVLRMVEAEGLPGSHHFYVAFDTRARGVNISKRLKDQYPDEMTIVLQHQFWDLKVSESLFEVRLSFNNIPERLVVPFSAIKVFFDPSVPYGLQFGIPDKNKDEHQPIQTFPEVLMNKVDNVTFPAISEFPNSQDTEDPELQDVADYSGDGSVERKAKKSAEIVELDTFRKK